MIFHSFLYVYQRVRSELCHFQCPNPLKFGSSTAVEKTSAGEIANRFKLGDLLLDPGQSQEKMGDSEQLEGDFSWDLME